MNTSLEIQNLKCGGCANTIIKKISSIEDVSDVQVNIDSNTVSFNYNEESTIEKVQNTLNEIGYPVVGNKNNFTTKAKSLVSCAIGRIQ
ncbi:heavy-metal-associated domain-containing protein [Algibacter amylolyticus]|uniref:Heavy-metal-associated domain-containing protein n=1 Tax=Algibacter amylolyticus TaxID=1608400 RepID=A0A5M7BAT2_9FLAO|nr:heavy-metal-associated domain-containing protein [Algibacter amylolyticus]KAA5824511.1 heavy-metal-associated domain-containing protein [Algibacter amylolyticus]MBB5269424.1 copper chaperone CopZ [Algibacter amylolyticus]TSJ75284.1 heavy-metal-associated domain-containing protein [Algibacter amylolyticus]